MVEIVDKYDEYGQKLTLPLEEASRSQKRKASGPQDRKEVMTPFEKKISEKVCQEMKISSR